MWLSDITNESQNDSLPILTYTTYEYLPTMSQYVTCNGNKNNIYIYTLTCSYKHVILHSRSCKYVTHKYVYRMKAYDEWSEEPLVQ